MSRAKSLAPKRRARRAALGLVPGLLALLLLAAAAASPRQTPPALASVFELELPELGLAPTAQPEIVIPTPNVETIVLNILRPQADQIDYGQIGTQVNGQSTGLLTEIGAGPRGKIVRINLRRYPGYGLVAGRNTVEVTARNQRGREFYTSFVLRTATENRNQEFAYSVSPAQQGPKQQVPPELVLLEPEQEIVVPPGGRAQKVRLVGVATATGSVASVTIDGEQVLLKRGAQVTMRGLALVNERNRVSFDALHTVGGDAAEVVVEATDAANNRTRLQVPVRRGERQAPAVFTGKKYALIVGISKFAYAGGQYDLLYADADARAVSKFLQTPAGGRFNTDNILLLTNEQATLAELQKSMKTFISQPGPEDLLLVFLATHGVPDPDAEQNYYLLAHDTNIERMASTAFAMKDFKRMLENNVRARRMVMLADTCHSAGLILRPGESSRGLRLNLISQYAEKMLYVQEGNAILTSSDVGESSQEGPRWGGGHGVFTHFLLQGMGGMADSDSDQLVTVGELFRFVSRKVRDATEYRQHPRMQAGTNEGLALAAVSSPGRR